MTDEKQTYEVWTFMGSGEPSFVSDDPVEIVYWLRARISEDENAGYNVHPVGRGFHNRSMIQHDFISRHASATARDMVRKAFDAGKPEGLAEALHDLYFNRYPWSSYDKVREGHETVLFAPPEQVREWLKDRTEDYANYRIHVAGRWGDISVWEYLGNPGQLVFGGQG